MVDKTVTIFALPVELRDNIVACLDIKDVLSFSLACKYFHAIMESRQTWMRFVQEIQVQPNMSKIEEPVEDFTTQELRDWVLRRLKIRQSLHSGSRATCHYIRGTDSTQISVLLPGGRWLLLEKTPGKISYADCDAPCPKVQSLITFEDVVPDHTRVQFVVWRDPHSPRLTCKVAILYWYHRENDGQGYQAYICKIDLVGHGPSAKLVAERLHLHQGGVGRREVAGEDIRGEYFYQVHGISSRLWNPQNLPPTLEILDYKDGSSMTKKVKLADFNWSRPMLMWRFDILPDGKIAASSATKIVIYPDPLPIIGNEVKILAPSHVVETIRYPMIGGPVSMSQWHLGLDSNLVVCGGTNKSLIAVSIPHDGTPPMNRTIEGQLPTVISRRIMFGLFHGVAIVSRACINILNYPWGDFRSEIRSGTMTRQAFYIERDQDDDIKRDKVDDIEQVPDDDIDQDQEDDIEQDQDASDTYEIFHGMGILYFNEEFGRTIIKDRDRGYFVIDTVVT